MWLQQLLRVHQLPKLRAGFQANTATVQH